MELNKNYFKTKAQFGAPSFFCFRDKGQIYSFLSNNQFSEEKQKNGQAIPRPAKPFFIAYVIR